MKKAVKKVCKTVVIKKTKPPEERKVRVIKSDLIVGQLYNAKLHLDSADVVVEGFLSCSTIPEDYWVRCRESGKNGREFSLLRGRHEFTMISFQKEAKKK